MDAAQVPRRLVLAMLLGGMAARAATPLPARNLRVEMRVDEGIAHEQAAGAADSVAIDSLGRTVATGPVQTWGRTANAHGGAVQQVLVLNGQRARLQLSRLQPLSDVEVAWDPWGAAAALRTNWIELVDGLDVWPRWSGGTAPVVVEIGTQRSATAVTANPPPQTSVFTTLQVPLGQWVDVAVLQRRGAVAASPAHGAATTARVQRLQLRISLA